MLDAYKLEVMSVSWRSESMLLLDAGNMDNLLRENLELNAYCPYLKILAKIKKMF